MSEELKPCPIAARHEDALRTLYRFCIRGTNNPTVAENCMKELRECVANLSSISQATYSDGYRAGLEAAAEFCEILHHKYLNEGLISEAAGSALTSAGIRALPVPEKQAVSVEDVANNIKWMGVCHDMTHGDTVDVFHWKDEFKKHYQAAMRACGIKVEG